MTPGDRCRAYAESRFGRRWPDSIPYVTPSGRWVYGKWVIGALFKNATRYPGAYPRTYLERVLAMYPDVDEAQILHLFSGSLPAGAYTRVDLRRDVEADIVGSVYDLPTLLDRNLSWQFRLVPCDPPYRGHARALYGTPGVESWRAFRAMAQAFAPGTQVVWLDTQVPMYRKDDWHHWGSITVVRSTNNDIREASFFERRAA